MTIKILMLAGLAVACAATKRDTQTYRADTEKLLDTRSAQIQSCYETALTADPTIRGLVTVQFVVEKKTGKFLKATVDPATTSAPQPAIVCVLDAVDGLQLQPPDANEGRATFIYELAPAKPNA